MDAGTIGLLIILLLIIITALSSLRICSEWERKVVLRLGRFGGVRGPGIFFLLPYIEQTPFTIDTRVVTSAFQAEQTLTKDGASVTVDAIMYWRVVDAGRAAIQVANYLQAVMGAFSAGFEHFAPWKTIDGRVVVTDRPQLEVLVRGVFEPVRFLNCQVAL